jgi:preprotein translocase subunit SecF
MRILHNLNVDFMGKRKFFYGLSITLFLIGFINILIRGLQFGIDFKGGTEMEFRVDKPIDIGTLRSSIDRIGLGDVEVKMFGGDRSVLIRTELQEIPQAIYPKVQAGLEKEINGIIPGIPVKVVDHTANSITYEFPNPDTANIIIEKLFLNGYQAGRASEEVSNSKMIVRVGIADWIKENLRQKLPGYHFESQRVEVVGPKVGGELKRDAVIAVFFSLIGILLYLAIRYKFIFAFGAVLALFHDVLITLGLYATLYGLIPGLNLDISLTVVAAFLTLIGYSVMDTVIVFDRVRETVKLHKNESLYNLMNMSINKTMSRTILTGGTTFLSCLVLLIFGGEVLRAFAFTLTFGIVTGTYSSIFIASSIVLDYSIKTKKKIEF